MFRTFASAAFAAALAFSGCVAAQQKASDIPIETFLKRADYRSVQLSPNGKLLGAIAPVNGRYNLAVVDLEKRTLARITGFDDNDVLDFEWMTNDRLTFRVGDAFEASARPTYRGRFAINVDASQPERLDARIREFAYFSDIPGNADEVIISANMRTREFTDLYKYNVKTGRTELYTFDSPGEVDQWVLDRARVPRVARSRPRGKIIIWYRDGEKAPWKKFWEGQDGDHYNLPVAFDFDNKTMYVSSNIGRDRAAIFKWDFEKNALGAVVAEHPQADVGPGNLIFSRAQKKLLGFRVQADKPYVKWFDPRMEGIQKEIDAALKGMENVLFWARDDERRMAVRSYSDVSPGTFELLDPEKRTLERAVSVADWIKPELMSPQQAIRYKARDGMEIPALLTIPKESNGKNLPLVVQVHGGPYVEHMFWGYNPEDQLLASRGYAVLSPSFRGTRGFGQKLFTSAFRQWGLSMQDDLVDGVNDLVSRGIVDKNRVCIYGGSYGGYATLYGVVKDPDVYRCGIAVVAVSDIGLLFSVTWSDTAQDRVGRFLDNEATYQIGDPEKDKEQFKRTSAVENAARIKAPLLLAYGQDDVRVPLIHGEEMKKALDRNGKKYEWVVYPGEGHGFNKDENRLDFWKRALKFLDQNLKPAT